MGRRCTALRNSIAGAGLAAPGWLAALVLLFAPIEVALAGVGSDCFPDRVVVYAVGTISSPPAFNSWQPGIVLGPPGNATPTTGSLTVLSLGHGGSITLAFTDNEIVDGPGPDFIVFENPFFCTAPPLTAADPWAPSPSPASSRRATTVTFPPSFTPAARCRWW
jgi:hypothetical protein